MIWYVYETNFSVYYFFQKFKTVAGNISHRKLQFQLIVGRKNRNQLFESFVIEWIHFYR